MNNNNQLINIVEDFSNKIFDIQQKLTDNEYKELIEELGKLYNNINLSSSSSSQTQNIHSIIPHSFYHACICEENTYKCISFNNLFNCNNRSPICHQVPFMEKVIKLMDNNRILGGFAALRYYMDITPNKTPLQLFEIKTANYLNDLLKHVEEMNASIFLIISVYLCNIYYIIKNPNLIITQTVYCQGTPNEKSTRYILNKLIDYISDIDNINGIISRGFQNYIYENINTILANYKKHLLDIKDELDLVQPLPIKSKKTKSTYLRPRENGCHRMVTRRQCKYKYNTETNVIINGRNYIYKPFEYCKVKCIFGNNYCLNHL